MLSPETIIDRQVDAYIRRDAEGFAALYEADACCAYLPSGKVIAQGRGEIEREWARTFSHGPIELEIRKRMKLGRFIIDHEIVRFGDAPATSAVAIYLVGAEGIRQVWFLKDDAELENE
tara:strand:+ start:344 stop:700 length:357 start_codon:yes stop_codon:yes gene_type:complete